MITGIGVDVTSVERVERSLKQFQCRFVERILHPDERADFAASAHPAVFLAKRFAIKEAAAKALGTGIREAVSFHDFVTEHNALGKPGLRLTGEAADRCQTEGISRFHVSLTDEGDSVTAFVVFEK